MKLSKAIKPISYFKANATDIIRELNQTQGTMIITQNGEAKVIVQDIKEYEAIQETIAMLKIVAQGKKSISEGRFRPAEEVITDFEKRED